MRTLLPLMTIILTAACGTAQSNAPAVRTPYVATAVGRIDSLGESRQLVASTDGVIQRVLVSRGQRVQANQPLLHIDCGPRFAEVAARSASLQKASAEAITIREGARDEAIRAADAQIAAARSALKEQDERVAIAAALINDGFVSKRDLAARTNARDASAADLRARIEQRDLLAAGARRSEVDAADATARAAAGEVGVARAMAQQCTLRSPVDGMVLQILRREGEYSGASQGTPLIVVGDTSQMIVRAEINERDAVSVRGGQAAIVWIDGRTERWRGHVTQLAGVMGRRSARSLDPTDRFDRDVREALVAFEGSPPPALVGLRVMVGIVR